MPDLPSWRPRSSPPPPLHHPRVLRRPGRVGLWLGGPTPLLPTSTPLAGVTGPAPSRFSLHPLRLSRKDASPRGGLALSWKAPSPPPPLGEAGAGSLPAGPTRARKPPSSIRPVVIGDADRYRLADQRRCAPGQLLLLTNLSAPVLINASSRPARRGGPEPALFEWSRPERRSLPPRSRPRFRGEKTDVTGFRPSRSCPLDGESLRVGIASPSSRLPVALPTSKKPDTVW